MKVDIDNEWKNKMIKDVKISFISSPILILISILLMIFIAVNNKLRTYLFSFNLLSVIIFTVIILFFLSGISFILNGRKKLRENIIEIELKNNDCIAIRLLSEKIVLIENKYLRVQYNKFDSKIYNSNAANPINLKFAELDDASRSDNLIYILYPELFNMENFPVTKNNSLNELRAIKKQSFHKFQTQFKTIR